MRKLCEMDFSQLFSTWGEKYETCEKSWASIRAMAYIPCDSSAYSHAHNKAENLWSIR